GDAPRSSPPFLSRDSTTRDTDGSGGATLLPLAQFSWLVDRSGPGSSSMIAHSQQWQVQMRKQSVVLSSLSYGDMWVGRKSPPLDIKLYKTVASQNAGDTSFDNSYYLRCDQGCRNDMLIFPKARIRLHNFSDISVCSFNSALPQ